MKKSIILALFFVTTLAFAGKKYEDQVIERITCPTQKCEEGQTLDIEIPSMMEETAAEDELEEGEEGVESDESTDTEDIEATDEDSSNPDSN